MKTAVLKFGGVILILLMISCRKAVIDSKKNISIFTAVQKIGSDSIITNSLDPNFDEDLINTLRVKKGDTVLFRKWQALPDKPVAIYDDKIKFKFFRDTVSNYYKTGDIKFTKYITTVLNTSSQKSFTIYSIAILGTYRSDPYSDDEANSYFTIEKKSKVIGTFNFSSPLYGEYFIDFKIKDNSVHIIKLSNLSYSYSETYKYELDTLIILKNKGVIYPDSLRYVVCKEKNRIQIKDSRK